MGFDDSTIRLSIIISCYSNIPFFADALDSFLNSGYHFRRTEFVICDDASPVGGDGDTARRYMKKYPDLFRMITHTERQGIAASYRDLVEAARGEYVLIFDADDIFVPFDIDAAMDYLDAHPECGASYGRKRLFNDEIGDMSAIHGGEMSLFAMTFDPRIVHNAMLIRVSDLKAVGSYQPTSLGRDSSASDIFMWIRLGLEKELHFEFPLRAFFRVHSAQKTSVGRQSYDAEYQFIGDWLIGRFPQLYASLEARQPFSISAEQRRPAMMLLGLLYNRAQDVRLKLEYLAAAEAVMPEDYAIYELRAEEMLRIGRYEKVMDDALRLFMCYPGGGSYATYQAVRKAHMAAEKLGWELPVFLRAEKEVISRLFHLSARERELFNMAIATGFRAREKTLGGGSGQSSGGGGTGEVKR